MAQPTITDIQAVDPVLTNLMTSYTQADDRFVADRVFPNVTVDKDSGTYYILTKKFRFLDKMEVRAPGDPFAQSGYGVETDTYKTVQWALEEAIADENRANNQMPMELESISTENLAQANLIRKERAFAADFIKTGVWGTTDDDTATDWDDFASGDPVSDIKTAIRTISASTGKKANTLLIGDIVNDALTNHPDIIDRIKYVTAATAQNIAAAMAAVFGLDNYWVADSSYNTANEGQAFSAAAIIDDDALVCVVNPSAGVSGATAGKSFVWPPGGGTGSMFRVRVDERHTDLVQIKSQWDQKVTAADMGYLFLNIV